MFLKKSKFLTKIKIFLKKSKFLTKIKILVINRNLVSKTRKPAVDFGSAPIGEVEKRTLIVENISDSPVLMKSSLLDPHGPFQLLNPLGEIDPGETHFLLLTFGPSLRFMTFLQDILTPRSSIVNF